MARLSSTALFAIFGAIAIVAIALFQTSNDRSRSSVTLREEIWWQFDPKTSADSRDSVEFERSNEKCPAGIPALQPIQVELSLIHI